MPPIGLIGRIAGKVIGPTSKPFRQITSKVSATASEALRGAEHEAKSYGVADARFFIGTELKHIRRINAILKKLQQASLDLSDILITDHIGFRELLKSLGAPASICKKYLEPIKGLAMEVLGHPDFKFSPNYKPPIVVAFNFVKTLKSRLIYGFIFLLQRIGFPYFSTRHSSHALIHEIGGHALHFKNLRKAGITLHQFDKLPFSDDFWQKVEDSVSYYAASERKPSEVIAEIATAKLVGKKLKLPPIVQAFWDTHWHGPELPFGLFAKK